MELIKPGSNFDFVGNRFVAIGISVLFIVLSLLSLLVHGGPKYGIDFTGGGIVQLRFADAPEIADIRAALQPLGMQDAEIQDFTDQIAGEAEKHDFLIRLPLGEKAPEVINREVTEALRGKFGADKVEVQRTEMVGPRAGETLRNQAIMAVLFGTLMMGVYVWFRFELRFGVGALVALAHDVILALGALSVFNYEVDLTIVAALLTIVGFSVNDTVIISDRIRENMQKDRHGSIAEIINRSINETLSRTIITTGTALLVVLSLYLLGGNVIRGFAFALLVGFTVGTYSSIFISSPIVLLMDDGTSTAATSKPRPKTKAKASA